MSQNKKSIENKISISYKIFSDCSEKVVNFLKESNVKFQVWKLHEIEELLELKEEDYGPLEKTINISIPKELYNDLDKLCKINNWDTDKKIIELLGASVFSAESDGPNGFKRVINF
jgi:hypothetical protein